MLLGRLRRSFYERYTPTVARGLLGCRLVRDIGGRRLTGKIVEAEAYRGRRDPASHAYRGKTRRNTVMFGPPGHAYVYFTYGFHYMLNFTTEIEGTPGAVLIRAIEPFQGTEAMMKNRGVTDLRRLASGPGNLTKALAIDRALNGEDLTKSRRLYVEEGRPPPSVGISTRVGVVEGWSYRWRFFEEGNRFVSKGKPSAPKP